MEQVGISKSVYRVLASLTGEDRADIALEMATKDLLRLKLKETEQRIREFETRYGKGFGEFRQAWEAGQIADKYSYTVERDYWEWEAAALDLDRLTSLLDEIS